MIPVRACLVLLLLAGLVACKREARQLRSDPPVAAALGRVRPMWIGINGATPAVLSVEGDPFASNAYQLSQGKRLFDWFNCQACHANGGGQAGPSFTGGWWRYGPDRISIFLSIRDGREHGMPAFGRRLTAEQIWQLTGYVRAMGDMSGLTGAPARSDEMQSRPGENRGPAAIPLRQPPSG